MGRNRARSQRKHARPLFDVQHQQAQDRLVRRELLVRTGGHQGAGALAGNWPDNLRLARMADEAGIDFLLPIGRWKGYGGDTDFQGATLETDHLGGRAAGADQAHHGFRHRARAAVQSVIAAKQIVTADHIGDGRFGLNIVFGWNEGEFEMFGVEQREHEDRYEYAQEWLDAIKLIWSDHEDFDFDAQVFQSQERARPNPSRTAAHGR